MSVINGVISNLEGSLRVLKDLEPETMTDQDIKRLPYVLELIEFNRRRANYLKSSTRTK